MKKYNTKPIYFTGCHPVIAEHLKQTKSLSAGCGILAGLEGAK